MDRCAACAASELVPHLSVKLSENGSSLAATTTEYGVTSGDIVRCTRCGHMEVDRLAEALDEAYAEVIDETYLEEEAGQRATARATLQRIERHVEPGTLLDVGAWVGFLVSEARQRGWDARGVEPSRFASAYAREQLAVPVETGTLEELDLPERHFDAVVLGDVIEHLPAPHETLKRIGRLLRPGGVIYLALPDAGSRVARVMGSRWWSVLPTHVQYFTRESVVRLLERHDYVTEHVGTAPKAFTVRYYLDRLKGYAPPVAACAVAVADRVGAADHIVWPDFRDRMAVVARQPGE